MSSTATTGQRGVAKFFATVRSCGVERSQDRWFAGVCGGVAERLGLDPLLVRGVLVALTVVGGLGLAAYGACWLLLPDGRSASNGDGSPEAAPVPSPPGRIEAEAVLRGDVSGGALLAGALVLADVVLPRALLGVFNQNLDGPGWGFLLTGLLALLGWWLLRDVRVPPLDPARRAALDAQLAPAPTDVTQPLSLVKDTPATPTRPSGPSAGFGSPTERRAAARLAREQARAAAVHARTEEKVRAAYEKAARTRAARRPGSPLLTTATLGLALLAVGLVVVASLLTASGPWSGRRSPGRCRSAPFPSPRRPPPSSSAWAPCSPGCAAAAPPWSGSPGPSRSSPPRPPSPRPPGTGPGTWTAPGRPPGPRRSAPTSAG